MRTEHVNETVVVRERLGILRAARLVAGVRPDMACLPSTVMGLDQQRQALLYRPLVQHRPVRRPRPQLVQERLVVDLQ
jgi:hypothetical protein